MNEHAAPPSAPPRDLEALDPHETLERQLRDSPELVERLLEEMPAGFLSVDSNMRVRYLNRAAEASWAFTREECLGRGIWEIWPDAATPETIDAMVRMAATGEPVQFEVYYDLYHQWIQVFAFPASDGFSAFFLDITDRRTAELERNAAEARYRDIIEEVPAITYLDDATEGRGGSIFVSPQSKQILGYSPEEWILNRDLWSRLIHPDDRDAVMEESSRCRSLGTTFEAEYRMLARDGRVVWIHDRSTPVIDRVGLPQLVHGVMVDITEHRLAQEEIERQEAILAAVGFAAERLLRSDRWESAIDDVMRRLGESAAVDRVDLIELQANGEDLLAWSRAEWCGPGIASVGDELRGMPMPGGHEWVSRLEAGETYAGTAGDSPCPYMTEVRTYALAPLLVASRLWGFLALGEVTSDRHWAAAERDAVAAAAAAVATAMERQQATIALSESEARFRRLADEAPDVIFRLRVVPELAFEYMSPAVQTMTGYSPDEWLADPELLFRVIHPDDLPTLHAILEDPERNEALRWIRRDGRVIWTEQRLVQIFDRSDTLVALEGIARDVTDRLEAQERLRSSVEALSRSNEERQRLLARLVKAQEEERERVANDIHDDSIQIMTAVGLRLAVLRSQVKTDAAEQTLTNAETTVAQAIRRLRRVLFELRPMSLDSSGLAAAITDHVRLMDEPDAPEFSIDDQLRAEPPVEARTILYRIAQEALTNVRKHARAEHAWIELGSEDNGVRVRIRDDGVGFDPSARPNGGPGHVGIPSMRERANLAGGWLRIDGAPGAGTIVDYWIPSIVAPTVVEESATVADPGSSAAVAPA